MAMNLDYEDIQINRQLCDGVYETSVDIDIIVPDAKPDVLKVVGAGAVPTVKERYAQKDKVTVSGTVDYEILYLSDEENGSSIRSIFYQAPFSHQIEVAGVDDFSFLSVQARADKMETMVQNSRKVSVKSTVALSVAAVNTEKMEVVLDVPKEFDIPQRRSTAKSFNKALCQTDEFEVGDALVLGDGQNILELLKSDARIDSKDVKIINNKVVVKGDLSVCNLYLNAEGMLQTAENSMEFTEVLDVPNILPSMLCDVDLCVKSLKCREAQGDDGSNCIIDMQAVIEVVTNAYEEHEIEVIFDAYCPDYDLALVKKPVEITELLDNRVSQHMLKEYISLDADMPQAAKIYNICIVPKVKNASIQGGKLILEGIAEATVIYLSNSEASPVCYVKKEFPFTHTEELEKSAPDADVKFKIDVEHLNYSFNSSGQIELRIVLCIQTRVVLVTKLDAVCDLELNTEKKVDKTALASITVYFVQSGDTLWDIAKRYHTTASEICAVNSLEEDAVLKPSQHLLIPKRK